MVHLLLLVHYHILSGTIKDLVTTYAYKGLGTLLHGDNFARGDFCTGRLLHRDTFAQGDTFAR